MNHHHTLPSHRTPPRSVHSSDRVIALLLVSACAPPGEGPPRSWRGDDVRAYKTDLPELDSATSVVCTPPTDDDLIQRLMQTYGGFAAGRVAAISDFSTPGGAQFFSGFSQAGLCILLTRQD